MSATEPIVCTCRSLVWLSEQSVTQATNVQTKQSGNADARNRLAEIRVRMMSNNIHCLRNTHNSTPSMTRT